MLDKLKAIRFFLKLGETLSFKATAAHFGVPSSTISRSIKALEVDLGVTLFERTTRQVRLTETGSWYRAEVSAPLRALAAADELVESQSSEPTGTLRITAMDGYGELRLFEVLERFREAYPQVVCDLELSDRNLDLSSGEIDVAIRATADPPDYLVAKRLHDNRFVLVASPAYLDRAGRPKRVEDIEGHAALAYRGPGEVKPWFLQKHSGEVITVKRRPRFVTNHGMLLLRAALAGDGLAFLPRWGVINDLERGALEEVLVEDGRFTISPGLEMSMYLLYEPRKARLGKVRALVDFLIEALTVRDEA